LKASVVWSGKDGGDPALLDRLTGRTMTARGALMKWCVRSLAVFALIVVCAFVFSACSSGGLSVAADPTDLIKDANFIDWEDLPVPVNVGEVYDQAEIEGAVVLPGSEPRRLLIATWSGTCMPSVTVAAPDPGQEPILQVAINRLDPAWAACSGSDAIKLWYFEVILARDVDPASVVLDVSESSPYHADGL